MPFVTNFCATIFFLCLIVSFLSLIPEYSIVLESVLSGHDGWVNGVRWKKSVLKGTFKGIVLYSANAVPS